MSVPTPDWGLSNRVCRHPRRHRLPVGWFHEIKHDGFRILAPRDSAGVRLITRAGNDFSSRFPFIAMAVSKLPVRSCLIDGEAIVCDKDGLAVFDRSAVMAAKRRPCIARLGALRRLVLHRPIN